jgi:hypothetical protein
MRADPAAKIRPQCGEVDDAPAGHRLFDAAGVDVPSGRQS